MFYFSDIDNFLIFSKIRVALCFVVYWLYRFCARSFTNRIRCICFFDDHQASEFLRFLGGLDSYLFLEPSRKPDPKVDNWSVLKLIRRWGMATLLFSSAREFGVWILALFRPPSSARNGALQIPLWPHWLRRKIFQPLPVSDPKDSYFQARFEAKRHADSRLRKNRRSTCSAVCCAGWRDL